MQIPASYAAQQVSVVMPAYNAATYIQQAADSVLQQSYRDIELIIVDDGSKDDTLAIARRIAAADARVIVIEQDNSGKPSIARNKGIARARGRYLSFLDSDDYWLPDRVARLLDGLARHDDWVASFHDVQLTTFDDHPLPGTYLGNGKFPLAAQPYVKHVQDAWHECGDDFFIFMSLRYAAIHTQSIMIDRCRLGQLALAFDENFTICEDTDLWIRIALQGKMGYLHQVLSCYRQHPTSITRNPVLFAEQALKFHQFNRARLSGHLDGQQRRAYRGKIADLARQAAYVYAQSGMLKDARSASILAFSEHARWRDIVMFAKALVPLAIRRRLR